MKCPVCGSDNYRIYEPDPDLMVCDQCHETHSVAWNKGYWIGFIDGEREALQRLGEDPGNGKMEEDNA